MNAVPLTRPDPRNAARCRALTTHNTHTFFRMQEGTTLRQRRRHTTSIDASLRERRGRHTPSTGLYTVTSDGTRFPPGQSPLDDRMRRERFRGVQSVLQLELGRGSPHVGLVAALAGALNAPQCVLGFARSLACPAAISCHRFAPPACPTVRASTAEAGSALRQSVDVASRVASAMRVILREPN
jgi:hypothetical protein